MDPNFSFLDDPTPESQIVAFRSMRVAGLIEGSSLDGYVAIIPAKSFAEFFPFAVCYLPHEVQYILSLDDHEARMFHVMKKAGGFLDSPQEKTK